MSTETATDTGTVDQRGRAGRASARWARAAGLIVITGSAAVITAVLRGGVLDGVDRAVAVAAREAQRGWLHDGMAAVSRVGGSAVVAALLLALGAVVSWRSWRWAPLLPATAALVVVAGVVAAGKGFLGPGPAWVVDVGDAAGAAFPCGPATATVAAAGVAMLLLRDRVGRPLHGALCVVVAAAAFAVGTAQVYLGHHRLSDVVASWVLGGALLAAVAVITRRRPTRTCPTSR